MGPRAVNRAFMRRLGRRVSTKRESPEMSDTMVRAGWNNVDEQVLVWLIVEHEDTQDA